MIQFLAGVVVGALLTFGVSIIYLVGVISKEEDLYNK